ncbi:hypothetical protein niasHS_015947 [Heterodera schachtii]|uniref:Uncharacterized protein n=1 Tax=Heterodera schachtii TaxID=97005 RepID=A0ABD2I0R8_HETSC
MPVVNVYSTSVTSDNISRNDLLSWVNDCLQSSLTKIEEMATGAAYCQLTDFLFPTKVPLKKVKWNSRSDVDWVHNWRVLQQSWKTIGIDKPVPVQSLIRAKFQDNFEFLQWFKKFFDANYDGHKYDSLAARNFEEFPAALPGGSKQRAPPPIASAVAARRAPSMSATNTAQKYGGSAVPAPSQSRAQTAIKAAKPPAAQPLVGPSPAAPRRASPRFMGSAQRPPSAVGRHPPQQTNGGRTGGSTGGRPKTASAFAIKATPKAASTATEVNNLKQQVQTLETHNSEVTANLAIERERAQLMERERNFYFDKLRSIEILCGACALSDGGIGGAGILRVDQVQAILWDRSEGTSSTDGGSSAQTRHSPQPHGDIPRLESPDAEQMHAMVMQQHNGTTQLDNSGHEIEIASGSMDTAHLEDTFLMSGVLGHERESDPLSRTQPVEEGKGEREEEERKLNSTYPLTTPHNKEHTEPDRTQTIEDGPTLLDLTHPVAIGGTAGSGDEPPKQQQHKQSQEHTDEEQRDISALAGVVPYSVTDDSSLLLLDPTLATACPLINIIDSPKLLEGIDNEKIENLEAEVIAMEESLKELDNNQHKMETMGEEKKAPAEEGKNSS